MMLEQRDHSKEGIQSSSTKWRVCAYEPPWTRVSRVKSSYRMALLCVRWSQGQGTDVRRAHTHLPRKYDVMF